MIAINLRYEVTSVEIADVRRNRPEWPPSPYRLQAALVRAALSHRESDQALSIVRKFVEKLPYIRCDTTYEQRGSGSEYFFVPVLHSENRSTPLERTRQKRYFPYAIPRNPEVTYFWPDLNLDDREKKIVTEMCRCVGYIGASSAFVSVWLSFDHPPKPYYVPLTETANPVMATLFTRTMTSVEDALKQYRLSSETGYIQNWQFAARKVGYCHVDDVEDSASLAADLNSRNRHATPFCYVLELRPNPTSPVIPLLSSTNHITLALHRWLVRFYRNTIGAAPEWVSGKNEDNTDRSKDPRGHVAVFPLVERKECRIIGVGLAFPHHALSTEFDQLIEKLGFDSQTWQVTLSNPITVTGPKYGDVYWTWQLSKARLRRLIPFADPNEETSVLPHGMGISKTWINITPVIMDTFPERRCIEEYTHAMRVSINNAGYPQPDRIEFFRSINHPIPGARVKFGDLRFGNGTKPGLMVYARLHFSTPVQGPILIGRGRFLGMGTFIEHTEKSK